MINIMSITALEKFHDRLLDGKVDENELEEVIEAIEGKVESLDRKYARSGIDWPMLEQYTDLDSIWCDILQYEF